MADDFDQLMLKYGAAPSQLPKQNTSYIPGGYTGGAGNKASGDDDFDSDGTDPLYPQHQQRSMHHDGHEDRAPGRTAGHADLGSGGVL